jgi:hypothetical protein
MVNFNSFIMNLMKSTDELYALTLRTLIDELRKI